jgi:hypothetical protein
MPHQKPLIDRAQLDRNRGEQLKAIDGLAARLQPGIARDGYSVSVQALVSLMTKFDSLTSPQRPYTWHGIAHWSGMTGLSPKQCSRAISVLQSLQLIEARVTWVSHGKRGMKIKINWSTVFEAGPITQDAEDLALWTARKTRQRTLFAPRRTPKPTPVVSVSETDTMSVSVTDTMSVSERDIVSVSSISNPQTYSPNHPQGEGVGEGSFQSSVFSEQDTSHEKAIPGEHGTHSSHARPAPTTSRGAVRSVSDCRDASDQFGDGRRTLGACVRQLPRPDTDVGTDVCDQSHLLGRRGNGHPVPPEEIGVREHKPELSAPLENQGPRLRATTQGPRLDPMAFQPVPPADLIQTLVSLNVADPRSAVKKSLTAGYSLDQIRAIVAWYQAEAMTDESGKLVYPYDPGQLVLRLRDRDAIDAEPAQGNWQGGKSGFWTRLAPISTPNPRKQPRQSPQGISPAIPVIRTTYTTAMAASEILTALEHHRAPGPVHQSFHRWACDGPIPKTLAFWLKANGYAVEESQQ